MIDRFNSFHRTTAKLGEVLRWRNVATETIPAYGVVQFKANYAGGFSQASKPSGTVGLFFANVANDVSIGGVGESRLWGHPQLVLISGSPTVGAEIGPTEDSWTMSVGGTGFRVIHQAVNGVGTVVSSSSGGTVNLQYGIVNADETRGYYTVEIAEWAGTTPIEGEVPDFCGQATGSSSGSGDDSCEDISLPEFESQLVGTGVYVLAYDPGSVLVPLEIGSDCTLADMGATNNSSGGTTEPVFQILRGYQTHTTQYTERWECCGGVDTLVARTAITFAAKVCQEAVCDPCGA